MSDNQLQEKQKPDNRTHAQKRRAEYQEEQREYLRSLGLLQQVVKDLEEEIPDDKLQQVKFKTETRLKLVAKYLPDQRETSVELSANILPAGYSHVDAALSAAVKG